MQVERVSVDSNFFDDLGADSMVMARFCARVRKRPDLSSVSIKDVYQHRTIRRLATALADTTPMPVERVFADMLADVLQVERVSVDSNFFDDLGADSMVMARFCARVRKRPDLPSVSIKDVYQHPTIKSLTAAFADTAPVPAERVFADVLADVMGVEQVPADSNFFDDLGADSMVMARFCARVRKRPDLPAVSIKDIYQYPTIKSLATALADAAPAPVETPAPSSTEVATPAATAIEVPKRAGTLQVALCGVSAVVDLSGIFLPRGIGHRPGL
jgi:acyl carrier protein